MKQEEIDRINELARKKKSVGLTTEEIEEQIWKLLREGADSVNSVFDFVFYSRDLAWS